MNSTSAECKTDLTLYLALLWAGGWAMQPPAVTVPLWFYDIWKCNVHLRICVLYPTSFIPFVNLLAPVQFCNCTSVSCIRFFMNDTFIFWRPFFHHHCNNYANQNCSYTALQVQKKYSACLWRVSWMLPCGYNYLRE